CRRTYPNPPTKAGDRLRHSASDNSSRGVHLLETLASATRQKHQQLRSSFLAMLPMGRGGRFRISLADRLDDGSVIAVRVDGFWPQPEGLHACAVRLIAKRCDDLAQSRVPCEVDEQRVEGLIMTCPAHEIVARQ